LFSCPYPSSDQLQIEVKIKHFDFGKPVIDFVVADGLIWVSLDAEWGSPGTEDVKMMRVVKFDGGEVAIVLLLVILYVS
jgi:hypothetical protein